MGRRLLSLIEVGNGAGLAVTKILVLDILLLEHGEEYTGQG